MDNASPFFSVLVPCYNVENFVATCIESIEAQSYDNWEIVAVDDGSTDATGPMLDEAALRLGHKLRVVHTPNRGLLLARREAFRRARGTYLICLDSDDTLRADTLEVIRRAVADHPGCLVQFKLSRRPDFSDTFGPRFPSDVTSGVPVDVAVLRRLVCKASSNFNNLCGKAIPASCVDVDTDYQRFRSVSNAEDLLQLLPILDTASEVIFLDKNLYHYRINNASITQTFNASFFDSVRVVNEQLRSHAESWGDDVCVELAEIRWLKVVYISCMQISSSDYSFEKLKKKLGDIASDADYRRFWELHATKLPLPTRLFLGDLCAGRLTPPAIRVCLSRGRKKAISALMTRLQKRS